MTEKLTDGMRPVSLRFEDALLERAFRAEQAQRALIPIRVAAVFALSFSILLWIALPTLFPQIEDVRGRFSVAIGVLLVTMVPVTLLTYVNLLVRVAQAMIVFGVVLVGAIIVSLNRALTPELLVSYGYVLATVHTLNIYALMRLRWHNAVIGGVMTVALYLAADPGLPPDDLTRHLAILATGNFFGVVIAWQTDLYLRREFLSKHLLDEERARSERLLLNVLPQAIAARLKQGETSIADAFSDVTVLFADIVGFTPLSARKTPQELVAILDRIFSSFDALAERHGLEKIKTLGDAYMVAGGIPIARTDHAQAVVQMGLDMIAEIQRVGAALGEDISLRIGVHSGPVVAGVIGKQKFIYDLWGDTVNTASRMESHGVPGSVHCTEATKERLLGRFTLTCRGTQTIKGKGEMVTYVLTA